MNQPSLVLPFTSLYGTSAYDINIQVGYCWSFVLVVNCVQFPKVCCIRSPASSQWDFWEAKVTAASRGPIVLLSELCYIGSIASFRISADSIFWRIFRLGAFVNLKVSTTAGGCFSTSIPLPSFSNVINPSSVILQFQVILKLDRWLVTIWFTLSNDFIKLFNKINL